MRNKSLLSPHTPCSPLEGERRLPLQSRGGGLAKFVPPPNPQTDSTPPQGGSGEFVVSLVIKFLWPLFVAIFFFTANIAPHAVIPRIFSWGNSRGIQLPALKFLSMLLIATFCFTAFAANIEQPLANTSQEQTARAIFHELKCVVCEGQSLADSDAALAAQMREHVRRLVREGKSAPQILATFRQSYGDKILLTPPIEPTTILLWLAPLLLLGIGFIIVWRTTRPKKGSNHG